MTLFFAVAHFVAVFTAVSATDYCSNKICRNGVKHIACRNSGSFHLSCPCDAEMVSMTKDLQKTIVDGHNSKRNFIAGGGNPQIRPACRMATMEWDNELAELAALNVKQCDMNHDKCHNTDAFKLSGQNLALISFYGKADHAALLTETIEMWYAEVKHCRQSYLDSFPHRYSGPHIGHFTVMMADRNIRVGCAAATYSPDEGELHIYLVACNYATTNVIRRPIYLKCIAVASSCISGTNLQYPNLCSKSESYDVNKWA